MHQLESKSPLIYFSLVSWYVLLFHIRGYWIGLAVHLAVTKMVIFAVDEDKLPEGIEKLAVMIERQMSHFATLESLDGLLDYLGDNPWAQIFYFTAEGFTKESLESRLRCGRS